MKSEIQQHPHVINPLTFALHQTIFDVLHFNAALKVINITMAYDNDENSITVCTTPLSAGRGVEPPNKFSERGRGLEKISVFRGGLLG